MALWYYKSPWSKDPEHPDCCTTIITQTGEEHKVYVARTRHYDNMLVGYVLDGVANFVYNGRVLKKTEDYQILTRPGRENPPPYSWSENKFDFPGHLRALRAGYLSSWSIPIYVGRANVYGLLLPGMVLGDACYVPIHDKVVRKTEFTVLMAKFCV